MVMMSPRVPPAPVLITLLVGGVSVNGPADAATEHAQSNANPDIQLRRTILISFRDPDTQIEARMTECSILLLPWQLLCTGLQVPVHLRPQNGQRSRSLVRAHAITQGYPIAKMSHCRAPPRAWLQWGKAGSTASCAMSDTPTRRTRWLLWHR